MSERTTRGITVEVETEFVEGRSNPDEGYYFFAYHVTIANIGKETAQLISRHWVITDGDGKVEHVRGPGVVGAQPRLRPGESFEYTSACPLPTPVGTMHGTYQMVTEDGEAFDAEIAPFTLAVPGSLN
jgi:ApaG protein